MSIFFNFRKQHAAIILIILFTVFSLTFIGKHRKAKKVSEHRIVKIEPVGQVNPDGEIEYYKEYFEINREPVEIGTDITQYPKSDLDPEHKKITCVICEKKIPASSVFCPFCGERQIVADSDSDGMPDDWELEFGFDPEDDSDAEEDADKDGSFNREEYLHSTNPLDPDDNPSNKALKLKIVKVFKKTIDVMFRGYMEKEEEYVITINWEIEGGKTFFARVGDMVRGYEILEFKKIIKPVKQNDGTVIDGDESYIVLCRPHGSSLKLEINKVYVQPELFMRISDENSGKTFDAYLGSEFSVVIFGKKETYTVKEISVSRVSFIDSHGIARYLSRK